MADRWWITTGWLDGRPGVQKILGPFESKKLALDVRNYVEQVNASESYYVDKETSDE